MNLEESTRIGFGVVPEKRDKLAVLKKAIREGAYEVKAEDIAEKILRKRLFEFALTLYRGEEAGPGLTCNKGLTRSLVYPLYPKNLGTKRVMSGQ